MSLSFKSAIFKKRLSGPIFNGRLSRTGKKNHCLVARRLTPDFLIKFSVVHVAWHAAN
jgi:hypothetical protein